MYFCLLMAASAGVMSRAMNNLPPLDLTQLNPALRQALGDQVLQLGVDQALPVLGSVAAVAQESGLARSTLYDGLSAGTIRGAVRIGRRVLIHRPTFYAWLAEQAAGGSEVR